MMNPNIYRLSTSAAAAALLIALCAAPGHAQGRRGRRAAPVTPAPAAASTPPWKQFKLNPAVRVQLDFRNASIDAVLRVFSQASGIPIVKDPALVSSLTLESPKPQNLNDAFSLLSVSLGLRNYEIDKQDKFLVVRQKPAPPAAPSGPTFPPGFNPANFGQGSSRSTPDLVVYPIKYASATELATVINDVYAQPANSNNNANPIAAALAGLGGNNNNNNNGGGGGGGGFRRRFGGGGGAGGASVTGNETVHASADDFSNSLIVNAPDTIQDQISDLIQQIDKPTDQPQQVRVFKLTYANASDLQPTIQDILNGTTPVGRAATVANTNNRNTQARNQGRGGFGFFFGGGGGGNSNSNGTVADDDRTNTLVVTASQVNLDQIAKIVAQLDVPANYESTTFVYVMKFGRADVVANLLNQSFGNRTTGGSVGGALSATGLAQTTLGSTSSSGTSAGGLSTNNTRNTSSNFQVTSANGTQNNTSAETTGFNAAGQVVNIRNLSGQVLLVPNIDTNSIIVSAPPEDRQLVEGLLEQLDEVPRQVMIETVVVEATLSKTEELGVDLGGLAKLNPFNIPGSIIGQSTLGSAFAAGTSATTDASGLPEGAQFTLNGRGYSAVLRAIQQDQKFNVLSTPRIFATNNATAEINVSESIPYISSEQEATVGEAPIYSYSFLDVGLILTVTPRILSNGKVIMDVTQTDNSLVGYNTADIPITNQREAETTVSVADGNTVVLGGIIQNSETKTVNKVPLLGDLPVLGNLFRSSNLAKSRTELLVFLTPHVVNTDDDATQLRKNTEQELGASTQSLIPKAGPTDAGAPNQK